MPTTTYPNCSCCRQSGSGSGCAIPGWAGPGWYCVRAASGSGGSGGDCGPLFLTVEDECDTSIVICSGPYATEAAAEEVCGNPQRIGPCATVELDMFQ